MDVSRKVVGACEMERGGGRRYKVKLSVCGELGRWGAGR